MIKVNICIHMVMMLAKTIIELKKSINEAKGACSKTVKTSKSIEKKAKKGTLMVKHNGSYCKGHTLIC